jgi:hypothetical protein
MTMRFVGFPPPPPKKPPVEYMTICSDCSQDFVFAVGSMEIETFVELARSARCPRGCTGKLVTA